jgi:hypothetical protein
MRAALPGARFADAESSGAARRDHSPFRRRQAPSRPWPGRSRKRQRRLRVRQPFGLAVDLPAAGMDGAVHVPTRAAVRRLSAP